MGRQTQCQYWFPGEWQYQNEDGDDWHEITTNTTSDQFKQSDMFQAYRALRLGNDFGWALDDIEVYGLKIPPTAHVRFSPSE